MIKLEITKFEYGFLIACGELLIFGVGHTKAEATREFMHALSNSQIFYDERDPEELYHPFAKKMKARFDDKLESGEMKELINQVINLRTDND